MERNTMLIGLLMLVVGLGIGYSFGGDAASVAGNHMMGDGTTMQGESTSKTSSMKAMTTGLEGKSGDEFDRAFLKEMIVHHEGAVSMAQMLLKNTTRPELQKLGTDIIVAQTQEIGMMRGWLKAWYGQ